jgi:HPt (histidine-containing phosphotransfer) domain-containing protein
VGQVRVAISGNTRRKAPVLVFDREHLARYTMDSPDLEREIVGLFVAQLPSILDRLFTAKSHDDWRFATHTLKGSAQAVGALQIGEIAKKLEPITCFEQVVRREKLLAWLTRATREFDEMAKLLYP